MPQQLNSSIFLLVNNLQYNYDIFFENTQLKPSSVFNILGVSFSRDLSWKDHITSLSKQASKRLGVLRSFQNYFTPPQFLALYRGVVRPFMEYASPSSTRIHLSQLRWNLVGLWPLPTGGGIKYIIYIYI